MSTFVLVHGGGHGGWCWDLLRPLLEEAGHDVHAPTLTGLGERAAEVTPEVDLDWHIADVVAVLDDEDLADVILVGHSYGGMVITGVADRRPARVGQLVYLDAASPRDGQSLVDVAPGLMDFARSSSQTIDGVELVLWPSPEFGRLFGVTDPALLEWMQERLTPQPWPTFAQPLTLQDEVAVRRIPRPDLICINELSGNTATDPARTAGADRVRHIETGHDLMITAPDDVATMLLQLTDG